MSTSTYSREHGRARIAAARTLLDEATAELRHAVAEEVECGLSVTTAAQAAGVTRKTLYAWLEIQQGDGT